MIVKLLTEHHLELLSFKGGCTSLSESTLAKYHIVGNHMSRLINMDGSYHAIIIDYNMGVLIVIQRIDPRPNYNLRAIDQWLIMVEGYAI